MQDFESLLEYLQQKHVMVLVTSRKAVGVGLGMAEPLRLGALPVESSMQLLTDTAGGSTAWGEDEASELVGICGYNALAITILAGLIKNLHCSPKARTRPNLSICLVFLCRDGPTVPACH